MFNHQSPHPSRRSVLRCVAPLLLFPTMLKISTERQSDGEIFQPQDHERRVHAVIVVTDSSIPESLALRQCEMFIEDGLHAVEINAPSCANIEEFNQLTHSCCRLIDELRANESIQTITVLLWCEALGPIKWISRVTNADAIAVRLYTSSINVVPSSLDVELTLASETPENDYLDYFFAPSTDPSFLAFRRMANCIGRGRNYLVQLERKFDPTPWRFDDFPLVNGKLIGERGDEK